VPRPCLGRSKTQPRTVWWMLCRVPQRKTELTTSPQNGGNNESNSEPSGRKQKIRPKSRPVIRLRSQCLRCDSKTYRQEPQLQPSALFLCPGQPCPGAK